MIGKHSSQLSFNEIALWSGGHPIVDPDSIYACFVKWGDGLIRDEDFESLYSGQGRPSISPALLAKVLLLMYIEDISDREAEQRARFDLRWKTALNLPLTEAGFDHTALCRFRARLVLKEKQRMIFDRFLSLAHKAGIVKQGGLQIIDSTYVIGASAVQDTYEMIRTALHHTARCLCKGSISWINELAEKHKDKPQIDWQDTAKRREHLQQLVDDSQKLIQSMEKVELSERAREAKDLLSRIVEQDVDTSTGQARIRQGVAPDRIICAHDPQMRHGRKTHNLRFDGEKAQVMIDEASEIITNVAVTPGNRPDGEAVGDLLDTAPVKPGVVMGDTAYGTFDARDKMLERKVIPVAPLAHAAAASQRKSDRFTKGDFEIDMENKTCRCPGGYITTHLTVSKKYRWFHFSTKVCNSCPLKDRCGQPGKGKDVDVHPRESERQEIIGANKDAGISVAV